MDTSLEGMQSSWATNTLGLVACAQQVIPSMTENGEGNIMVIGADIVSIVLQGNKGEYRVLGWKDVEQMTLIKE